MVGIQIGKFYSLRLPNGRAATIRPGVTIPYEVYLTEWKNMDEQKWKACGSQLRFFLTSLEPGVNMAINQDGELEADETSSDTCDKFFLTPDPSHPDLNYMSVIRDNDLFSISKPEGQDNLEISENPNLWTGIQLIEVEE